MGVCQGLNSHAVDSEPSANVDLFSNSLTSVSNLSDYKDNLTNGKDTADDVLGCNLDSYNDMETVRVNSDLVQVDFTATDRYGENTLHKALQTCSVKSVKATLEHCSVKEVVGMLQTRNTSNWTPLDYLLVHNKTSTENLAKKVEQAWSLIMESLQLVDRYNILSQRCNNQMNVFLNAAVDTGCFSLPNKTFQIILEMLDLKSIHKLLTKQNGMADMIFYAADNPCTLADLLRNGTFEILFKFLSPSDIERILAVSDGHGDTAFHRLISSKRVDLARVFLEWLSAESILSMLTNRPSSSPLLCLFSSTLSNTDCNICEEPVEKSQIDMLKFLIGCLPRARQYDVFEMRDSIGDTILHKVALSGSVEMARLILDQLEAEERVKLLILQRYDGGQETPFILALKTLDVLAYLLTTVSQEHQVKVLQIQAADGKTVLHHAVEDFAAVRMILESSQKEVDKRSLIMIKNIDEETVLDQAECKPEVYNYLSTVLQHEVSRLVEVSSLSSKHKPSIAREDDHLSVLALPRGVDEILHPRALNNVSVRRIPAAEIVVAFDIPETTLKSKYKHESERLLSYQRDFKSIHMTSVSLARSGFISMGKGQDEVVCLWCQLELCNFKQTVDVSALHFAHSENICDFIKSYRDTNIALAKTSDDKDSYLYPAIIRHGASDCEPPSMDSGFNVVSMTTNHSMTAAQAVLTINPSNHEASDTRGNTAPLGDVSKRYTAFETRTEVLAELGPSLLSKFAKDPFPMRHEQFRLKSFVIKGWSLCYAKNLALAGFYISTQLNDTFTIACPFCDGKITDVPKDTIPMFTKEKDHSPLQVHILNFPACAFIQGNNLGTRGNVPMTAGEFRWNVSEVVTAAQADVGSELSILGVATTQADCPPMAVYERRFDSFLTLPYDHPRGAEELATCGFYLGTGGETKCFWCGVECGSWSSGEDVWVRHARSMRSCQFVINEKGAEFVTHVREEHGEWIDSQRDEDRIRNVTTRMIRPRMDAPVVQAVISMGYTRDHVKTAIINRLKKLKPDYTSIADLVSDVLALRNKDMTYHRNLKLPDVKAPPQSSISENQLRVMHTHNEATTHHTETFEQEESDSGLIEVPEGIGSQQPAAISDSESAAHSILDLSPEEGMTLTRQMMSQLTCKICISSAVGIIFLPCAHLVCCTACAAAMTQCPMCRRDIAGTIKANV